MKYYIIHNTIKYFIIHTQTHMRNCEHCLPLPQVMQLYFLHLRKITGVSKARMQWRRFTVEKPFLIMASL